jgi:hypothetical protein
MRNNVGKSGRCAAMMIFRRGLGETGGFSEVGQSPPSRVAT